MPPIPWPALYDNPSESQPGWNFLQDARTRWLVDGAHWMIHWVRAEPAMQQQFMRGADSTPQPSSSIGSAWPSLRAS
ncbi:hypothetical protein GB937_010760 [Aspergillus fischeri]|nr:hypothetical protein GB937_010760 [Aspergillus fischeri]